MKVSLENVGRRKNSRQGRLKKSFSHALSAQFWPCKNIWWVFHTSLQVCWLVWSSFENPVLERSTEKAGDLSRWTQHVLSPDVAWASVFHFSPPCLLFSSLCAGLIGDADHPYSKFENEWSSWRRSTGSMFSCSSLLTWSDARFSQNSPHCCRLIPQTQKSQY